jgi:hypothetical protein
MHRFTTEFGMGSGGSNALWSSRNSVYQIRCTQQRCLRNSWDFYKNKIPCLREQTGVLEFNLDDDLLSHGETPHYHRRCIVSLLSSGWDQVVPMLYGRQEIRVLSRDQMALASANWVCDSFRCFVRFELSVHFVFTHRNLMLLLVSKSRVVKLLGCYRIKLHEQLVSVS